MSPLTDNSREITERRLFKELSSTIVKHLNDCLNTSTERAQVVKTKVNNSAELSDYQVSVTVGDKLATQTFGGGKKEHFKLQPYNVIIYPVVHENSC